MPPRTIQVSITPEMEDYSIFELSSGEIIDIGVPAEFSDDLVSHRVGTAPIDTILKREKATGIRGISTVIFSIDQREMHATISGIKRYKDNSQPISGMIFSISEVA